jgi:predicted alpha/beta-hydrolase family hydrolase
MFDREIKVDAGVGVSLLGDLVVPPHARGMVLFAHGSGSSRHSPRNLLVAQALNQVGLATLLIDLLTPTEEEAERVSRHLRFDIPMLAERLLGVLRWLAHEPRVGQLAVGLFGASTGAAAALITAAGAPDRVSAVVSRGGRPDLAGPELARVRAPTLLIVGGDDPAVLELNREATRHLTCVKEWPSSPEPRTSSGNPARWTRSPTSPPPGLASTWRAASSATPRKSTAGRPRSEPTLWSGPSPLWKGEGVRPRFTVRCRRCGADHTGHISSGMGAVAGPRPA